MQQTNKNPVEIVPPPSFSNNSSNLPKVSAYTKTEFVPECNANSSKLLKKEQDVIEIDYSQPLDLTVKRSKPKSDVPDARSTQSYPSWEAASVPRNNGTWHKNRDADFWLFSKSNGTASSDKAPASTSIYEQLIEKSICSSLQNSRQDFDRTQHTKNASNSFQKNYPTSSKGLSAFVESDRKVLFNSDKNYKPNNTNYAKHLKPVVKPSAEAIQHLSKHYASDKNKLHYKQNSQSSKTYYRPASLLASHRTKKNVDSPESRLNNESENGEEAGDNVEEAVLDSQTNLHLRSSSALSASPSLAANGNSSKPLTNHSKTFSIPASSYKPLTSDHKNHEPANSSISSGLYHKRSDSLTIQSQKQQGHSRNNSLVDTKLNLSNKSVEQSSLTKPEVKKSNFESGHNSNNYNTNFYAKPQKDATLETHPRPAQTKPSSDNSKDISQDRSKSFGNKQSIFYQNQLSEHVIQHSSPKNHQVSPLNKSSSLLPLPRQSPANEFNLFNRRHPHSELRASGRPSTTQPHEMRKSPMPGKRPTSTALPPEKKNHYSHVHNKVLKNPNSSDLNKRVDASLSQSFKKELDHHPRFNERVAPTFNSLVSQRKVKDLPLEIQKLQHSQLMSNSRVPSQSFVDSKYTLPKKTRPIERSEDLHVPKLPNNNVNKRSLPFSVDRLTSPNDKAQRAKDFIRNNNPIKKQTVSPANLSRAQMMFKSTNSTPPRQQIRQESPRTPIAFNPSIAAGSNAQLQSQLAASQRFSMPGRGVMPGFPSALHQQQMMQPNLQQIAQQLQQDATQRAMLMELFKSMQQPRLPIQSLFQAGLMANFQQSAIRPDQLNSAAIPPQYFDPSILQALSGTPFLPFQNNQQAPNSNNRPQNYPYPN